MQAIQYVKSFRSNRNDAQTVAHDALDTWDQCDFEVCGMNELLKDQKLRRLYFDFDDMKTVDDVREVLLWLKGLSAVFGRVCYAGYTLNEDVSDDCIGLIEEPGDYKYHDVSIHAVFPDTRIDNDEMHEIMTSGNYVVNRFVDKKVYKRTGMQQLLRHPYAQKNDSSFHTNSPKTEQRSIIIFIITVKRHLVK